MEDGPYKKGGGGLKGVFTVCHHLIFIFLISKMFTPATSVNILGSTLQ